MKNTFLLLVLFFAGCMTQPVTTEFIIPYKNYDILKYYNTNSSGGIVFEFWGGNSMERYVGLRITATSDDQGDVLTFSIYDKAALDGTRFEESKRIRRNAEGNFYTNVDTGIINPKDVKFFYRDDEGLHLIPYAGVLPKPFEDYVPKP